MRGLAGGMGAVFFGGMRWLSCFFAVVLGASAQTNILINGGFEDGGLLSNLNIAGPFSISGWSGVAANSGGNAGVVFGVDNGLAPAGGGYHFTFNGGNPSDRGYLEQSFATVVGGSYSLEFSLGRSGANGQALLVGAAVTSGGSSLLSVTAAPGVSGSYTTITASFVATGSSATLRLSDLSGGNSISDLYVDNVSVTWTPSAIPEPHEYAVIAGAAALVAAEVRRRRMGAA